MATPEIACVPMKLDCLVMNDQVGQSDSVKVAPITQPNYTFLRLNNDTIQNDVIPFTDLQYTSPAERNQRLTDLGTGERRWNREGVYVAWTLPRAYRMGIAGTQNASSVQQRAQQGFQPVEGDIDFSNPDSRPVPTRWLIVRYINPETIVAQNMSDAEKTKQTFQAWVLDGDRLQLLEDIPLLGPDGQKIDLQTDVSPFVMSISTGTNSDVEQQAEVFIGRKTPIESWSEDDNASSVPISLLNSSNDLFADYQPHNSNVFSMIDPMTYTDTGGNRQKMDAASASYYVIGWHRRRPTDVMSQESLFYMQTGGEVPRSDRMSAIAMQMKDAKVGNASTWQTAPESADMLCHGAMYNVPWSNSNPPPDQTAQSVADTLANANPIAIGTSAADSLIALIKAHVATDAGTLKELETDLIQIQSLIIAQEDGVDANLQALDVLENNSFSNTDGGSNWYTGSPDDSKGTFTPSGDLITDLSNLNDMQAAVDTTARTMQRLSWDMFSLWWRFVSGALPNSNDPTLNSAQKIEDQVTALARRWNNLKAQNDTLTPQINILQAKLSAKKGTQTPFSARKDPTLVLGGVQAGWPVDFLKDLQIRLHTQTVKLSDTPFQTSPWGSSWGDYVATTIIKLPKNLQDAATNLLAEFSLLQGSETVSTSDCVIPLYHDAGSGDDGSDSSSDGSSDGGSDSGSPTSSQTSSELRDQWYEQPWFPLFVEWQAVYYHIPYDDFSLTSRAGDQNAQVLRWGIKDGVDVSNPAITDIRSVSGRCLILPQPTYSLAHAVKQLLKNLGAKVPLDPQQIAYLNDPENYNQLPFLSTAMTGLTPHLTTRMAGTHIKPTQRPRAEATAALAAAQEAATDIGMGSNNPIDGTDIIGTIINTETGLTPYGIAVSLGDAESAASTSAGSDSAVTAPSPFKPVSHGQLRFSEINVIDRFGRAVCVIEPSPTITANAGYVLPCLSDLYTCQTRQMSPPAPVETVPNTVTHIDGHPEYCEYLQIPPSINQPARINLSFCTVDDAVPTQWRPLSDNDRRSPVYGWLVMNYADYAIQFFLGDGTFYRELRFGGPQGSTYTPAWTPFAAPPAVAVPAQLDSLIQALIDSSSPDYLHAVYDLITLAFGQLQPADPSYAQYLNSIIGRPLALVNIGVSLELAAYPLSNESNTTGTQPYTLLDDTADVIGTTKPPPASAGGEAAARPGAAPPTPPASQPYPFPVQLGDMERSYDGLLGFWKPLATPAKAIDNNFDFTNMYTFWPDAKSSNLHPLQPDSLSMKAFVVAPDQFIGNTWTPVAPADQTTQRNAQLQVVSALIDPFQSVHAISGTLPTVSIKLPRWTAESALSNMTAFFHMGPVLSTANVPGYNKACLLQSGTALSDAPVAGKLGLPALKAGTWRWLQPYPPQAQPSGTGQGKGNSTSSSVSSSSNPPTPPLPYYNPFSILPVDTRPRFEPGPYTMLEGYLQLAEPLTSGEPTNGTSSG